MPTDGYSNTNHRDEQRYIPNSFQVPNVYIDELMALLTPEEFKVLIFTVRHIFGWHDKLAVRRGHISLSVYVGGFSTSKGDTYGGTGLSRPTVVRCLDALAAYGILEKVGKPGKEGQMWTLPAGDFQRRIEELTIRNEETKLRARVVAKGRQNDTSKALLLVNDVNQKRSTPLTGSGKPALHIQTQQTQAKHISAASAAASGTDTDKASISLVPKDEPVTKTGKSAAELQAWRDAVCDALRMSRDLPVGMINNYLCLLCHITEPKSKKSEWLVYRLNKPLASLADVQAFGKYVKRRTDEQRISPPTTPETIARWATDYQAQGPSRTVWINQQAVE